MILLTGGTGFIGRALTRHLNENGHPVRLLVRPSTKNPNLPKGLPLDISVSSLTDARGLRAAMVGIDTIYHLASSERHGERTSLMDIEIEGTRAVVEAAVDARVKRFFFVSHLGADRASAFAVLKAKAIGEEFIRRSGLNYTIIRSSVVFGQNDSLTTGIARLLKGLPYFFFIPGDGQVQLQPIWVEDLATILTWAIEDPSTENQVFDVGGPEYLTFRQIVEMIMSYLALKRLVVGISPPYMRGFTVLLESIFPGFPTTVYWLDYLASNRTTSLDTATRHFGVLPSRMSQRLAYLEGQNWGASFLRTMLRGRS